MQDIVILHPNFAVVDMIKHGKDKADKGYSMVAEREGFEPPEPCDSTVFKTAALNRSAISPWGAIILVDHLASRIILLNYY